jgi:hypothetical protein
MPGPPPTPPRPLPDITHPLQVFLMGAILFHGVRAAISAVVETRRPGTGSYPAPVVGPSQLRVT